MWRAAWLALLVVGCATTPNPPSSDGDADEPELLSSPDVRSGPAPLIESPPLEPVQVPAPATPAAPPPPAYVPPLAERPAPTPPVTTPPVTLPPVTTPPVATPPVVAPAPEPTEDTQMIALLSDLSRYGTLSADELRREVGVATQALNRQRNDANRVRLGVLYTLSRNSQDEQRALQLFEGVAKGSGGPTSVKQLAAVLGAQVTERQRAVRDEQVKSEQAVRKLDQLLEMERALIRDRVRSGGGGGGGGGGSSGGH